MNANSQADCPAPQGLYCVVSRTIICRMSLRLTPLVSLFACLFTSCSKPAPLSTSFRPSALDSAGLVLQVRNTSSKSLSCAMTATNRTDKQTCRYSFSLAPNGSTEIGLVEAAWSFKSGESVEIAVEGHDSLEFKVP